jgi:hypothetical protein
MENLRDLMVSVVAAMVAAMMALLHLHRAHPLHRRSAHRELSLIR